MIDDPAIKALVSRLARPTTDGRHVIERAAILAAGPDAAAIEAWIVAHAGQPDLSDQSEPLGLHIQHAPAETRTRRFVLPSRALSRSSEPRRGIPARIA